MSRAYNGWGLLGDPCPGDPDGVQEIVTNLNKLYGTVSEAAGRTQTLANDTEGGTWLEGSAASVIKEKTKTIAPVLTSIAEATYSVSSALSTWSEVMRECQGKADQAQEQADYYDKRAKEYDLHMQWNVTKAIGFGAVAGGTATNPVYTMTGLSETAMNGAKQALDDAQDAANAARQCRSSRNEYRQQVTSAKAQYDEGAQTCANAIRKAIGDEGLSSNFFQRIYYSNTWSNILRGCEIGGKVVATAGAIALIAVSGGSAAPVVGWVAANAGLIGTCLSVPSVVNKFMGAAEKDNSWLEAFGSLGGLVLDFGAGLASKGMVNEMLKANKELHRVAPSASSVLKSYFKQKFGIGGKGGDEKVDWGTYQSAIDKFSKRKQHFDDAKSAVNSWVNDLTDENGMKKEVKVTDLLKDAGKTVGVLPGVYYDDTAQNAIKHYTNAIEKVDKYGSKFSTFERLNTVSL